jgi:hypothetical protein
VIQTAAGILLLLILVANVVAYMQHGPAGVRAWWRSKLIGHPAGGR